MNTLQELALIKDCIANKRSSQNELFNSYAGYVLGIAKRYFSDDYEAKDTFLKAFELAFKNLEKFDATKGPFKFWIRKITINTALNKIRLTKRFDPLTEYELSNVSPDNLIDELIDQELLIKHIHELKHPYGVVFNMVLDGYKHKDIAKELNITEVTSRSYLNRGRKMIQEHFKKLKIDLLYG